MIDPPAFAAAYLQYSRRLRETSAEAFSDADGTGEEWDGWGERFQIIERAPASTAWEVVLEILRQSPDEDLGLHAVGPLEDLVRLRGSELVEQVEAAALADDRFRDALGEIWLSVGDLPSDVLDHIVRASGGRIVPLVPSDPAELIAGLESQGVVIPEQLRAHLLRGGATHPPTGT